MLTETYALDIAKKSYTFQMKNKGFSATLKRAERLQERGIAHGLPPGYDIPTYPVDALPAAPEDWMRGDGNYVCPVDSEWGLWFDWTSNDRMNTAILPSVKGMNPITGQAMEGFKLDQYKEKCPVHDVPFKAGLLCEKCGYKWPPQSYVSYPNVLWWDGFRQPDGKVRQFFFSEDEKRDIASLVIGKENTVPAFGFAFFETVKRREIEKTSWRLSSYASPQYDNNPIKFMTKQKSTLADLGGQHTNSTKKRYRNGGIGGQSVGASIDMTYHPNNTEFLCSTNSAEPCTTGGTGILRSAEAQYAAEPEPGHVEFQAVKSVSVGAGAEINQELSTDTLAVNEWKPEPSATIRLYFVFRKQFTQIVKKGGVIDLDGDKSGFLKGLPVG
jgi:hypothetical protein